MVLGLLACCGESFGWSYDDDAMEINESSYFKLKSESIEMHLMDRPSKVADSENGEEWNLFKKCND